MNGRGVLVFNKEMVETCLAINACMYKKERKEGRKEGGRGLWLSLRCGLYGHQCAKLPPPTPPKTTKPMSMNFIRLLCISQKLE
jgi:hypothetical protein